MKRMSHRTGFTWSIAVVLVKNATFDFFLAMEMEVIKGEYLVLSERVDLSDDVKVDTR